MKKYTILSLISFILVVSVVNCGKNMLPANSSKIPIRPDDSTLFDLYFVEGVKQKLLGNSGEALGYLERCVKINPESDAAYFQMAQIAFSVGNRSKGKIYSRKANSLDPDNIWYMMMLASNYFEENNLDSAIYYYEQAAERYPEKEELLMTLG
ncbi:MAG: tetratricopeptide repeat protein, partial [Bacteroidales bacterium]|nr:tetratricopeptide repeat protein [Bacteroidales bacterium]